MARARIWRGKCGVKNTPLRKKAGGPADSTPHPFSVESGLVINTAIFIFVLCLFRLHPHLNSGKRTRGG